MHRLVPTLVQLMGAQYSELGRAQALIVAGNGLFKPNISTMIGKLYAPGDVRRDSGFTIFYMGINLGAMVAPFITATWIGVQFGLKWGFFAAGIGMILSTLFLEVAKKSLGQVGQSFCCVQRCQLWVVGKEEHNFLDLLLFGDLLLFCLAFFAPEHAAHSLAKAPEQARL